MKKGNLYLTDNMNIKYTKVIQITLLYILGIIGQLIFSFPLIYILISTALFMIFLILKKRYRFILLLSFFMGMGNTYFTIYSYYKADIKSFSYEKHFISGEVINYPMRSKRFLQFLFRIEKIDNKKAKGAIQVFIKPRKKIGKNYNLVLHGKINTLKGPANFGEFDYGLYYKRLKINGTLFINDYKQIKKVIPIKKYSFQYIISSIRNDIKKYIKKYYHPVQASFLNAILIGEKTEMPDYIKDIFIQSGTIHLLAISGLHVGLITMIFLTIFINLRIPKKTSFLLILIFLVLYNLIIGYKAPILRSTLMFIAIIFCYLFDRDRNYLNSLSIAGFIILLVNPLALTTISFQMSFLATAGIIIFTPVFNEVMGKYLTIKNKGFHFFKSIFFASLSAQIFIFPVLMFNFKQFSYISFLTNLAAIPLTLIILFLSLFAYFFYHLIPILTILLTRVSNFIIALLIYILNFFCKVPLLKYENFNYTLLVLYLCIIFLLFKKIFIKRTISFIDNYKVKYGLISVLLILLLSGFIFFQNRHDGSRNRNLEVVFFNIRGRSVLIKTPSNKYLLIDSGYEMDTKKQILSYFKRNKIEQIDYLILSNITTPRSQGIAYLLKKLPVKKYFDSGYFSEEYRYGYIQEIINKKEIEYKKLISGSIFSFDNIEFNTLSPPASYFKCPKKDKLNEKNNSLVLKMTYKNKSILFCGDIKGEAVKFLISNHGKSLKADIINLPDLNRDEKSISALLGLCKPSYAVINKRFTYFEKKDKEWTRQTLKRLNIEHYFTKDDGAVKVIINKNDLKIITSFNEK